MLYVSLRCYSIASALHALRWSICIVSIRVNKDEHIWSENTQAKNTEPKVPWSATFIFWSVTDVQDYLSSEWLRCGYVFPHFNRSYCTRGNTHKLFPVYTRINVYKHFFSNRVVEPWNCLPTEPHHFLSLYPSKTFYLKSVDLSKFAQQ